MSRREILRKQEHPGQLPSRAKEQTGLYHVEHAFATFFNDLRRTRLPRRFVEGPRLRLPGPSSMLSGMLLDHALWPDTAAVNPAGGLVIAGCDLSQLAVEHGTPLYALDEQTVRTTAEVFTAALGRYYPARATVHYASKALLNTAIAQLMVECGLGLDSVSLGALSVARRAGLDLQAVHLHGNAKPPAELEQALAWGTGRIVVDSLDELQILDNITAGCLS